MLQKSTLIFNAIRKGGEEGWKRGGELMQLGVNCCWSSIVVDERTPKPEGPEEVNPYGDVSDTSLRAGDRAPDARAPLGWLWHANGVVRCVPPELSYRPSLQLAHGGNGARAG